MELAIIRRQERGFIFLRDEEELITNFKSNGGDTSDCYKDNIYSFKDLLEYGIKKTNFFF